MRSTAFADDSNSVFNVDIDFSQALLSLSVTLASYPMNARVMVEIKFCEVCVCVCVCVCHFFSAYLGRLGVVYSSECSRIMRANIRVPFLRCCTLVHTCTATGSGGAGRRVPEKNSHQEGRWFVVVSPNYDLSLDAYIYIYIYIFYYYY